MGVQRTKRVFDREFKLQVVHQLLGAKSGWRSSVGSPNSPRRWYDAGRSSTSGMGRTPGLMPPVWWFVRTRSNGCGSWKPHSAGPTWRMNCYAAPCARRKKGVHSRRETAGARDEWRSAASAASSAGLCRPEPGTRQLLPGTGPRSQPASAGGRKEEDAPLLAAIERVILAFPGYGYPRVTQELQRQGWVVNHKRVHRVMGAAGLLQGRARGHVRTTDSDHGFPVYPNLLAACGWRELTAPNEA